MKLTTRMTAAGRRLAKDERGVITIEFAFIAPALMFAFLFLFSSFHGFRINTINQKAAYTIGDMVSRETTPIDSAYVTGTLGLFEFMTAAPAGVSGVRITAVKYDEPNDTYELSWSQGRGTADAATADRVANWKEHLPTMPDNEVIMVVETYMEYDPVFNIGLSARSIENFIFTRPRYAPQVLYNDGTDTSSNAGT